MIINIPLQIDEQAMETVVERDYRGKVNELTEKYIINTLAYCSDRTYGDKTKDGMRVLIERQLDSFIKEYRDEIIETAAEKLAERLARSKKGKELLGDSILS